MPIMPVKVDLPGLSALIRKVGKAAPAAVLRGLLSGALRAQAIMQARGDEAGVFDRGEYRRGWKARATARGAVVENVAPHAPIVEEGRRPGARMPPVDVIERWTRRKLSVAHVPKTGKHKGMPRRRKLRAEEARGIAFVVARAIARRGLPAKHVLRDATSALAWMVAGEVRRELTRAIGGGP